MSKEIEFWEISAFLDGDLPNKRLAEIGREAARDPAVRDRLDDYAKIHATLIAESAREAAQEPLPAELRDLAERLEERLVDQAEGRDEAATSGPGGVPEPASWKSPGKSPGKSSRKSSRRSTPAPESLLARVFGGTSVRLKSVGLVVGGIMVGLTAGSFAANLPPNLNPVADYVRGDDGAEALTEAGLSFVDEATEIHRVLAFAPEFSPRAQDLDLSVVSSLFAIRFMPPDLDGLGFALDRVDVSATDTGPALVLLYRDADGTIMTLVLAVSATSLSAVGEDTSSMKLLTYHDLAIAVGRSSDIAYAVTSSLSERRVRQVALELRASLEPVL